MIASRLVRGALVVYGAWLGLNMPSRERGEQRRREMLQTFRDGCESANRRGGPLFMMAYTARELWDITAYGLRRRFARRAQVSAIVTPSRLPGTGGGAAIGADVRHAFRSLAARRADSLLVVALLATGVATSSVVFGAADALLLRPAPFPHAERLAQIWSRNGGQPTAGVFLVPSMPMEIAARWLDRRDLFTAGGVHTTTTALVTSQGDPELVPAALVSPGLFEALGVVPALGRTFAPDEGRPGNDRVVIISEDLATSRFGNTHDALGRPLRVNDADFTVIAVMPRDFRFPASTQRLWMPIHPAAPGAATRLVTTTVRMQPGLARATLSQVVAATGPLYIAEAAHAWHAGATTVFMDEAHISDAARRSIWLLFLATMLLLAMVGLNVANLGMAKVFTRTRDAAIRSALGASRWRLVRQALVEELVVGVCSLAVALPLAAAGLRAAQALMPAQFTRMSMHVMGLDPHLLIVIAGLALATPVLAGLVPAVAGSGAMPLDALRSNNRSNSGTRRSRIFRDGLLILQVACAAILLMSAALLGRSFVRLQTADPGFDSRNLVVVDLAFPRAALGSGVAQDLYLDRAVDAIRRLPGVLGATPATGVPPLNGAVSFGDLMIEGGTTTRSDLVLSGYDVRPEFFGIVGIRLKAGRFFTPNEDPAHRIIDASLASTLWGRASAVGKRFTFDPGSSKWWEVVGVVETVRDSPDSSEQIPQFYRPLARHDPSAKVSPARATEPIAGNMRVAVRVADPADAIPAVRRELKAANPAVVIRAVERVDDEISRDLDRPRFLMSLMFVFAGAGLLLAAAGVYGVLSCLVSQRMRELGVRLMLGADPAAIGRHVLASGLAKVSGGLVIGVVVAAGFARAIASLLFDVNAHDVASYVVVGAVILFSGVLSSWRPARRAMRADPLALMKD